MLHNLSASSELSTEHKAVTANTRHRNKSDQMASLESMFNQLVECWIQSSSVSQDDRTISQSASFTLIHLADG